MKLKPINKSQSTSSTGHGFGANSFVKRAVWLLLATIVVSLYTGINTANSDTFVFVPEILKIGNPELFKTDIHFHSVAPTYFFVNRIIYLMMNFIPLNYSVLILTFFATFLLIYGIYRCVRVCVKEAIPNAVILTMMITTGASLLGNRCFSGSFHPQQIAFGFLALIFSFLIERRLFFASFLLIGCSIFHPLLGIYGLGYIFLILCFIRPNIKLFFAISLILATSFAIGVLPSIFASGLGQESGSWRAYINLLIYLRAPWHHLPSDWGWFQLFLPAWLAFLGVWLTRRNHILLISFFATIIICLIGVINNEYFQIPSGIIVNPLKMGPTILLLFWCIVTIYVFKLAKHKWWCSVVLVLTAQTTASLLLLLMVIESIRYLQKTKFFKSLFSKQKNSADITAFIISIMVIFISNFIISEAIRLGFQFTLVVCGIVLIWFAPRHSLPLRLEYLACILLIIQLGWPTIRGNFPGHIILSHKTDKAWVSFCQNVKERTPINACIVIPPQKGDFQLLSERSSFVSFKHFPYNPTQAVEWSKRLEKLGIIQLPEITSHKLNNIISIYVENYYEASADIFSSIKKEYPFVGYCVVRRRDVLHFPLVYENTQYRLYALN